MESTKNLSDKEFKTHLIDHDLLKDLDYSCYIFNEEPIIHKLSHQHLHTKFWIITVDNLLVEGIPISNISSYPVPILIGNFIDTFNF